MNNQAIINERINKVMSNPKLKNIYILEYKRETGRNVIDEGFKDWLSDKFGKAKEKAKEVGGKVSRVYQGVKDIGFLGRGTTILGGEETFDIEKRKQMINQAEEVLNNELNIIAKRYNNRDRGTALKNIKTKLDNDKFPNDKSFDTNVKLLNQYYNIVVDSHQKKELDEKTANILIAVLRHLVIYYQDYKIHDQYLYLNEQQYNNVQKLLKEQEEEQKLGKQQGDVSKSYGAAYSAKLPVGLALAGVSMVGLGITANSPAFQSILERFKDVKTITQTKQIADTVSQVAVGKGQGLTQVLQTLTGENFGPNAKISSLTSAAASKLLPALKQAVIAKNPNGGAQAFDSLMQMAQNNPNATLGSVLQGPLKGTGQKIGDLLDIDAGTYSKVLQQGQTLTNTIKLPQDTIKNQFIKYMGNNLSGILAGLGIATLVGAGASAAIRMKGSLSSRMSTLKKLVDSFKDVGAGLPLDDEGPGPDPGPYPPPPPPPEPQPEPQPEPEPVPDGDSTPTSDEPIFYVRKRGGDTLRRTSLNTLLKRRLERMDALNLQQKTVNGLLRGVINIAYNSLKDQGANIQESILKEMKPPQFEPTDNVKNTKQRSKKVETDEDYPVDTSGPKHKYSVPVNQIQEFVRDFYSKNYPQSYNELSEKDKETQIGKDMVEITGNILAVIRNWISYQTNSSKEQLRGKKNSEEIIKKAKETLGINESQIARWKQLAGIIRD